MTNSAQCFCTARLACLRDGIVNYGHAMPIGPGNLRISGRIAACNTPLSIFALGRSVPIFRGTPPTSP